MTLIVQEEAFVCCFSVDHMMPDLGSQLHCTLYTFIVLGKIMYLIYSKVLFSIVLSFFCVLIFHCFNKRISVSPKPGMVYCGRVLLADFL